jgi:hypothetical protein
MYNATTEVANPNSTRQIPPAANAIASATCWFIRSSTQPSTNPPTVAAAACSIA